jgi:hypothetical protein
MTNATQQAMTGAQYDDLVELLIGAHKRVAETAADANQADADYKLGKIEAQDYVEMQAMHDAAVAYSNGMFDLLDRVYGRDFAIRAKIASI